MSQNQRVRIIAVLFLFTGLVGSGYFGTQITNSAGASGLSYTDRSEDGDPPMVSLGIAMGAMRGMFVNYLWLRATRAKEDGQFFEAVELAKWITRLQPRLPQVWTFHAWNMAYNISVTTQTPEERWGWVNSGIQLLRNEGLRANPNDMHMHKELAWIFLHKVAGYTDDSNRYYKKQFVYEWTNVLGRKPLIDPEARDRDSVIEQYVDWIQPIVNAPATRAGLRERNPKSDKIAKAFEATVGEQIGMDLLSRYTVYNEVVYADMLDQIRRDAGPKTRAFIALRDKYKDQQAWDDLIAHTRLRVLEDVYFMEPIRMVQQIRKFGPIDFRLPAAHALYWGSRGTDVGRMEVNEHNADSLDFVNAYRLVNQSIQDLWRFGDVYFNYLDVYQDRTSYAYFQSVPNPYFVETYGSMLEEVVENSGRFESESLPYRQFAAGYANFLRDAIRFYYRRGDIKQATHWFSILRNWRHHNINDDAVTEEFAMSLKEFADKQIFESMGSPQVAVSEVVGALQGAFYSGLMVGDVDLFRAQWKYAREAHAYFFSEQFNLVVASTVDARMEFMDRDFPFFAGNQFANALLRLRPAEAETLYGNAPNDLRQYAYDTIVKRFKAFIDEKEKAGESKPFDLIFPEPDDMETFRLIYERKIEAREDQGDEGAIKN